jgi:molecular chaperone GrpE (heat shock protein)
VEPEFIIDEEPIDVEANLRGAIEAAICREAQLRTGLRDKDFAHKEDLHKEIGFLNELIAAMENRCEGLIQAEERRLQEERTTDAALAEERRKWLQRVQRIHEAYQNVLTRYGVMVCVPSGQAQPERDEIRDAEGGTKLEPGTIIKVLRPAYLWRGQVLRPSQVITAAPES